MKTIFIASFHPIISRNIISTDIISLLIQRGCRIVVLVPDYKKSYFEENYPHAGVLYEGVDTGSGARSKRVIPFKRFAEMMPNTRRAALGRQRMLSGERKSFLSRVVFNLPAALLGKSHIAMRIFRVLDFYITPRGRFYPLFETYKPDLVFSTDMQNEQDIALMQDAMKKNIKIVGMLRSWDNLISRGLRVVPATIIAHNNILKEEAHRYYGIMPERFRVVGIPHYDAYLTRRALMRRDEFLRSIGADPKKKLIVYGPICDFRISNRVENDVDVHLLEILSVLDATIVVRFAPTMSAANIEGRSWPPHILFDKPGYIFDPKTMGDRDVAPADDRKLQNLMAHADIVVTGPSTLIIDALLFDKPVVMANFFPRAQRKGEKIYEYEVEHIMNVLGRGAVRLASHKEEFLSFVKNYLDDPTQDSNARKKVLLEQCGILDGRACKRIADILLQR